jgi:rubrerythrin
MASRRRGHPMFTIGDIIDLAVQIEENGERLLRDAARESTNPELASMLNWLADEEVRHVERFTEMKGRAEETVPDSRLEDMGKAVLRESLGDQTFTLKNVDFSSLDKVEDLLERIIEFENDTILFYEMIRSFVKDQGTLDLLDAIIREEESHIRTLEGFMDGKGQRQGAKH